MTCSEKELPPMNFFDNKVALDGLKQEVRAARSRQFDKGLDPLEPEALTWAQVQAKIGRNEDEPNNSAHIEWGKVHMDWVRLAEHIDWSQVTTKWASVSVPGRCALGFSFKDMEIQDEFENLGIVAPDEVGDALQLHNQDGVQCIASVEGHLNVQEINNQPIVTNVRIQGLCILVLQMLNRTEFKDHGEWSVNWAGDAHQWRHNDSVSHGSQWFAHFGERCL